MSLISMRRIKVLVATVFVLGVFTAGLAYSLRRSRSNPIRGFTIMSRQTFAPTGEDQQLRAIKLRNQTSDGSWKQISTYYNPDGTTELRLKR